MRISLHRPLALAALLLATPAVTQSETDRVPQGRMNAFVRALEGPADSLADFFPRHGAVAWMLTTRRAGTVRAGRWLFDSAELPRAIDHDGPLCETFTAGGDAIPLESLAYAGMERGREMDVPWRRAGSRRFVPSDAPARSATFVQWRREEGRWVIDSFGNERRFTEGNWPMPTGPNPILPDSGGEVVRAPLPADAEYAAGAPWFVENQMIVRAGERLVPYGGPRHMDDFLRRYGTVNGVAVYVDTRSRGLPDVVYVPVSPDGLFQAYVDEVGTGCAEGEP